jgi:membrane fusion protein, heavy metal efflux system
MDSPNPFQPSDSGDANRQPTIVNGATAPRSVVAAHDDDHAVSQQDGPGWAGRIVGSLLILLVAVLIALVVFNVPLPWQQSKADEVAAAESSRLGGVQLVPAVPNTLQVPKRVRESLGMEVNGEPRIYEAKKPTRTQPLVMPGSTALDPSRLMRIRVRFAPCEAYAIAKVPEEHPKTLGIPEERELRTGDQVKKGQLLATVYSIDVGQKKNDLIDAVSQLKLDEKILDLCDKATGALPEVFVLNALRNVEADHNNIARALNTLKAWNIPKEDIDACFKEADEIIKRRGKREHNEADLSKWARVDIKAPEDGVIIERNVSVHEIVVDNTVNLFQIAKVDQLSVFANVPEDDVPALQALPTAERRWTVKTVGSKPVPGLIDDIGYLIDPNQHTALVKGHIDNPKEVMRAGQFISATVELPPPDGVVEVPVDAVVEDGQLCVVFVQDKAHKDHFTMRRVQPTQRFDKTVFIRSKPFAKGEQRTAEEEELGILPKEPLLPGERILTSGVGELKAALLDLQSEANKEGKNK